MDISHSKRIVNIVSAGIVIGVFTGFIFSLQSIVANQYIQYKMFRLIAVVFQKYMNYGILFSVIGLIGLYVLWLILVEMMKCDKDKVMKFYKLAIVISGVGAVVDWMLRQFSDIPLLHGFIDALILIKRYVRGIYTLENLLHTAKNMLSSYFIFICIGIIAIPLLYLLLKRLPLEDKLKNLNSKFIVAIAVLSSFLLLLLNAGIIIERKGNISDKPNVIFIVVDALRADHVSAYGYERLTSANIDSLVNDGIMFKNAVSQGNRTPISMPAMFTGLYTRDQGVHMLRSLASRFAPLSDKLTTITELFKNAGYTTQAVSCQPWISPESGYGQGFDDFAIVSSIDTNLSDQQTVQKAIEWIDNNKTKRFFLFLNLMGPHAPYHPPSPYDTMYFAEYKGNSELFPVLKDYYIQKKHKEYYKTIRKMNKENTAEEDLKKLIALYDGKIAFTDKQIGALIDTLKSLNMYTNTMIVLTSDHGEGFLEHNEMLHGRTVYSEEVRVPLIMTYPDKLPKGEKMNEIVELVDIVPTVAGIVGIPVSDIKMRGHSIYPMDNNQDPFAYTEGGGYTKYMTDKWSLVCKSKNWDCELYDLGNDRQELNNVIESSPAVASELKNKLFDVVNVKMYPSLRDVKTVRIPEETKKTLKSLGYLQ